MKTLKKLGLGILAIIVLFIVVSFFLPSMVHVERSIVIKSSPEVIFEQINTLKNWEKWSPWHSIDTAMVLTYEGPGAGNGAKYSWKSENPNVGNGILTINASVPFDSIITTMDFLENGKASGTYHFEQTPEGVKVTWGMDSDMGMNPIGRFMGLFMDKMIGPDFEKGLAKIKEISETVPAEVSTSTELKIEETTISQQPVLTIKATCKAEEIPAVLGKCYADINDFIKNNGLKEVAQPFAIYHKFSMEEVVLEAGIPINNASEGNGKINGTEIKAGRVVLTHHYGPYEAIENIKPQIIDYIKAHNLTVTGPVWEVYITDPSTEADQNKWYTQVYYPVQ